MLFNETSPIRKPANNSTLLHPDPPTYNHSNHARLHKIEISSPFTFKCKCPNVNPNRFEELFISKSF